MLNTNKWDVRFLSLAREISTWSKDPSTKCGSVIVDSYKNRIVSTGYNGFPRYIADTPKLLNDREEKYKRVIHCEMNAILFAKENLEGFTLYTWPDMSCVRCAAHVIQTGIGTIVYPVFNGAHLMAERWGKEFEVAEQLFKEANIEMIQVDAIPEWYEND